MQQRTLFRATVFFAVSLVFFTTLAHVVFAEGEDFGEIPLPEHEKEAQIIQGIGGVGTTNYIPKFVSSTNLGNSVLYETNSKIGIGLTDPSAPLDVAGNQQVVANFGTDPAVIRLGRPSNAFVGGYYGSSGNHSTAYLSSNIYYDAGTTGNGWPVQDPSDNTAVLLLQNGGLSLYTGTMDLGTQKLVVDNTGNVGIGTQAPETPLDVRGAVQIADVGSVPDTEAYATFGVTKAATTNNESYIGLTKQSNIPWGIGVGGQNGLIIGEADYNKLIPAPRLTIAPYSGNIGINTSSPARTLDVNGNFRISSGDVFSPTRFAFFTDGGTAQTIMTGGVAITDSYANFPPQYGLLVGGNTALGTGSAPYRLTIGTNAGFEIGTVGSDVLNITTDGSEGGAIGLGPRNNTSMFIATSGYVGIGTTNPSAPLDINGLARATAYRAGSMELSGVTHPSLRLISGRDYRWEASPEGSFYLYDQTGSDYRFFVQADGKTGIGTLTPSEKLDVAGYVKGQSGLCIGDDCRTSWPSGGGGNITGGGSTNYLAKFTGASSIGNSAIYDNGNIGIGTTNPTYKLDVSGTARIDSSTTGDALYVRSTGAGSHALRVRAGATDAGQALYIEGSQPGGIFAKSSSTTIYAETWGEGTANGSSMGVWGLAAAATSTGGATLGVLGESRSIPVPGSDTSNGIFGWGNINDGRSGPVYGRTYGVWGETDSKGPPTGEDGPVSGVTGVATNTESGMQSSGVVGRTARASSSSFGVYYQGGISGTGLMSSIVRTDSGPRLIYASQSTEPWVEDYGEGRLKNGYARITLDPIYLQTVAVDADHPFHVFVTPIGTSALNGIRVIKDTTGFRVQELNGGKSNATFDWRIVAKRKDFADRRLNISEGAYNDPTLYPERFPDAYDSIRREQAP